ncbi:uncharacterized protein LOC141837400 [Curcuma longa]|uniref:uncharacterized protein LOC141837400 n=1 Tax=Curcuma longa TaxID=136217 RepID=UPI003D9E05A6
MDSQPARATFALAILRQSYVRPPPYRGPTSWHPLSPAVWRRPAPCRLVLCPDPAINDGKSEWNPFHYPARNSLTRFHFLLSSSSMAQPMLRCPENAFVFNSTLCACDPGRWDAYDLGGGGHYCAILETEDWALGGGPWPAVSAPHLDAWLPLDSLGRMARTTSEAGPLKAAAAAALLWLAFWAAVRLGSTDGGRSAWFRIRWGISRLDRFDTQHELEDNKVVMKRKTELGGAFSVARWIFLIGLLSSLMFQLIRRSLEIQRVRPSHASDFKSFITDLEFNITTISSMSCLHLQGLNKSVIHSRGSVLLNQKIFDYSCYDTSFGPLISLKCDNCQVARGDYYVSWQLIDLPNDPAVAVGFRFNLSAKGHGDSSHVSYASGTLSAASYLQKKAATLRGPDANILKIHLFQQKFVPKNFTLIQPLVHDFLPGSYFHETSELQASLQSPKDGVLNSALYIHCLSDFILEIDKENVFGIVINFLSECGGIYAVTLGVFLSLLHQCESGIKKLQSEHCMMRDIQRHRRAQKHWDKLRIYVKYRWGRSNLNRRSMRKGRSNSVMHTLYAIGSLHIKRQIISRYDPNQMV